MFLRDERNDSSKPAQSGFKIVNCIGSTNVFECETKQFLVYKIKPRNYLKAETI